MIQTHHLTSTYTATHQAAHAHAHTTMLALFAALSLLSYASAASRSYAGYSVLRITPTSPEALAMLKTELPVALSVDWWREPSYVGNYVDAQFGPDAIDQAKDILADAGLQYEVFVEDVQEHIEKSHSYDTRLKFSKGNDVDFDYSVYHDLQEVEDWMQVLEKTYPDLVE